MTSTLNIGIIGLGRISAVHIKTYQENEHASVHSIAENNTQLLAEHGNLVKKGRAYTDYRFMLKDPDIDVVAILLPHYLHTSVIEDALKAGKHVICEKPLVTDPKDVQGIRRLSQKTGKYVYIKQYFRFSALHHEAMKMMLKGEIGKPYLVSCLYTVNARDEFNNPLSWRFNKIEAGGGVFMDVGIHMLDFLQELFGHPKSVTAIMKNAGRSLPAKGEDLSVVTLEYRGGIVVNIICTAGDSSYGFRWEKHFFGSEGSIHLDDTGKQRMNLLLRKNNRVHLQKHEVNWWVQANTSALNDIIGRIARSEPPAISLDDAGRTLRALRGAYISSAEHKTISLT